MHAPRRPQTETTPPSRRRTRVAAAIATAALAAGLVGCSPDVGGAPSAEATVEVALPDTALGEHAQWVIDAVNGAEVAPAAAESRLSAPMLDQISGDQLIEVFTQLEPQSPWVPTAIQDAGDQAVITLTPAAGDALDMQIVVDDEDLIAGLLFTPSAGARTPAASWSELEETVNGFAADTTFTVTDVADGTRVAAAGDGSGVGDEDPLPSGSMFKLYVLGAVADQVANGALKWDGVLTVTDDVRSLPSGELQDAPTGTTVTVQEAAEKMIAISDNTATDLLMAAVGPAALEKALADMGHHDPALNTPMLTTRALFQLGWGADAAARTAWTAATTAAEKQAVLDALPTGVLEVPATAVVTPVWQDGLEWFTTPDDLIAAHLALQEKAATDAGAPLRGILSANSGLGDLGEAWYYAAFKGGSSVGVLAGSWYLERSDGRAFVITIQGSTQDPAELADQIMFFGQVQDAIALLEKEQ
ncbi:serine hydrolase [Microbacterium sp. Sa4CUA7]|uniref:Beta-lactamase n=1 Tax=Microbacterium pullorum TaxID=2762236 RepID=A0ABR8S4P8_9MICO|nr:Cpe/LpqF family protein [Microbacterium pullorum]MBD7958354.1 serine hydrolase [Microbacterium pullorum]